MATPLYIDATMLLRWKHLAPVGIVRLERLLCARLRASAVLGPATYVVWEHGYRPATIAETTDLDHLLLGNGSPAPADDLPQQQPATGPASPSRHPKVVARRAARASVDRLPPHLRPFAEQALITSATFAVESSRYARRRLEQRRALQSVSVTELTHGPRHAVDFSSGGDLVALGLGWEYLDHEAMYRLKVDHGLRIHMPAFDLIGVDQPQFNAGQRHLVHRYYTEMAHYADTVTCISEATLAAMRRFYERESLPVPHLAANPLPGITHNSDGDPVAPRPPFHDEPFVLTVSTIEIRKNHLLLAKLWAELIAEGRQVPHLVLVGRHGWDVAELIRWYEYAPELQGRFHILADVEDDELLSLYDRCLFTVFPSRVEGWGLPITESLMRHKVCVHSTDPAQLEASQAIMPALHPDDFMAWKAVIVELLEQPTRLAELERRIVEEYRPRTADEYAADFEQLLAQRREAVA